MFKKRRLIFLFFLAALSLFLLKSIDFRINNLDLLINPKEITPVSPLYLIKTIREDLQFKFIFGNEDTAYWYFSLAEKRIHEAEILKTHGLESLRKSQINLAVKYQSLGLISLKPLIDVINTNYLKQAYEKNEQSIIKLSN